ncbi:MAG: hypothetical protein M9934_12495 [Thermomicrobiales bacterium]|nr:hypothetical protein [Thermomicrobiales bacterium]
MENREPQEGTTGLILLFTMVALIVDKGLGLDLSLMLILLPLAVLPSWCI